MKRFHLPILHRAGAPAAAILALVLALPVPARRGAAEPTPPVPASPGADTFPTEIVGEGVLADQASGEVPAPRPPPRVSAAAPTSPDSATAPQSPPPAAAPSAPAPAGGTAAGPTPPASAPTRSVPPARVEPGGIRPPGPAPSSAGAAVGPDEVAIEPASKRNPEVLVTLNFKDADVNQVLALYGELTGKTIIRPAALSGTVTIRSLTKLSVDEALQALDAVLAMNNLVVFPFGEKFLKVAPSAQAKQEAIGLVVGGSETLGDSDRLLTEIIPLEYVAAADMLATLQPHIRGQGQIQALERTNSLLITETEVNLKRLHEIIGYVDQPSAVKVEQKIYLLKYADAGEVAAKLAELIADSGQQRRPTTVRTPVPPPPPGARTRSPQPPPSGSVAVTLGEFFTEDSIVEGKVRITADERTNQLIILSRPINFSFFDKIIEALDRKVDPDLQIRVFQLKFAKAEELAQLLGQLTGGTVGRAGGTTRSTSRTTQPGSTPSRTSARLMPVSRTSVAGKDADRTPGQLEGDIRIISDDRTNFLIIMAHRSNLDLLEDLIDELDIEPKQVLIEAIIAEVSLNDATELGVEWVQRAMVAYNETQVGGVDVRKPVFAFAGASNTDPTDARNPLRLLTQEDIAQGLPSGLIYYLTFFDYNIDVLLRAMASSSNFRIRAQPILQTSNNKPARILIGESRPVITQTQTSFEGGSLRSSYEYRDIGIELDLTPRINQEGMVVIDITNKVDDVIGFETIDNNDVPIISTREASAQVYMADRTTVVLGGLISNGKTRTEIGVPLLRRIPVLGYLFRSERTQTRRTELILFITPHVLPTTQAAAEEAKRRAESMQRTENVLPWEKGTIREHAAVFRAPEVEDQYPDTVRVPLVPPEEETAPVSRVRTIDVGVKETPQFAPEDAAPADEPAPAPPDSPGDPAPAAADPEPAGNAPAAVPRGVVPGTRR